MPRSVIYQGDLDELLEQYKDRFVLDGECAKLPQGLTDVGHTSRWQPGPRVVDLAYLLPGTVIANFKFDNGVGRYPNQHGYHAGLFVQHEHRTLSNGMVSLFLMIDQWVGNHPKTVSMRPLPGFAADFAQAHHIFPCDNANEFYVVVVP
jgi:hypothetical protein